MPANILSQRHLRNPAAPSYITTWAVQLQSDLLVVTAVLTPGQVVIAERQVPIALSGDLKDGVGNSGLD